MCWVMSPTESIRVGSYGSRTQNRFGFGYTIGPKSTWSGSNSLRSCVRTHFDWILPPHSILLGPTSWPITIESCLQTQSKWVLLQDPRFLGFRFLNIIICVINIVIFIIIKSINIKIIIICIINIIIFIIINIIYKIINKFEKQP
jgi:hypothetical protein